MRSAPRSPFLLAWSIAACATAASACGAGASHLDLGSLLSETTGGQDHRLALELVAEEINGAGGVLGQNIAFVNQDDHADPARAGAAARTLITTYHVTAIVGAITSAATLEAEQVTTPNHVVLISGSSTAAALTGRSPYLFRTVPSDAQQGLLLAERAISKGVRRAAVIHVPGAYGMTLSQVFGARFSGLGGKVVFDEELVPDQTSYVDLLRRALAAQPEAILLVDYITDATQIVRDYNLTFPFEGIFWFFSDSLQDPSFVIGVGESAFSFQHEGTGPAQPIGDADRRFERAFSARYGLPPESESANYYDAAFLVALAMQEAGTTDGKSIRDHMRSVADPPGLIVGPGQWAIARAALQAGMKINYEGASGSVDLDENGDVLGAYDIWKVENGQLTVTEYSVLP